MDVLEDKYSSLIDDRIKKIDKLNKEGNPLKTIEKRVDLLSFCMEAVCRAEREMLTFKDSHIEFDIPQVINYDYKFSSYANKLYVASRKTADFMSENKNSNYIKSISREKKEIFVKLIDPMLRISARWFIERMINVFELDTPIENRAFPKRKNILKECIFFADRMNATRLGIKFKDGIMPKMIIFAVQPSAGKSFVANVYSLISLCMHRIYYKISGLLRMSNNAGNAMGFAEQIKGMIENDKISSVYPEFKKYFSDGKPKILDRASSEEWRMAGLDPRIRASHYARGRDAGINGIRTFCSLVIDDLSDGFEQMNNDEAHQKMTAKFYIDMDSRAEDENLPVFILGTMFNEFDIQNSMIRQLEDEGILITDNKFMDVRRTPDYSTIVITVDCFDENGESKAPKLISTKKLRQKQNNLKPYEFDLVYRQIRSSREPRIFDYKNLKLYTELPKTLKSERIAVLDPTRKNGADYFSLPVFAFDSNDNDAYFIDCIYEQKSLGKISDPYNMFFDKVIRFLIDNNVKTFYIENNTSNTLGVLIEEKLKARGYFCRIIEFYTSREKGFIGKLPRILKEEATITSNIRFPAPSMYPPLHRISQFMLDFTRFDSKLEGSNRKQHDDAPDSVAMFSYRCLFNRQNRFSEISSPFSRKNLWKI